MNKAVAAVEFGSSKVVSLIGRRKPYGEMDVMGVGVATYAGIRNGGWVDIEGLQAAVDESLHQAESTARRKIHQVYIGVEGDFLRWSRMTGSIDIRGHSEVDEQDVLKAIDVARKANVEEGRQEIYSYPTMFFLDNKEVNDPIHMPGRRLELDCQFASVDRRWQRHLAGMMDRLGLTVVQWVPTILAESLLLLPPDVRDKGAILIDVGYFCTNVALVQRDGVVYHRSIPVGGFHFVNDLMAGLGLSLEQAEASKRRFVLGYDVNNVTLQPFEELPPESRPSKRITAVDISTVIEARAEELAELILWEISKASDDFRATARGGAYLTGGGIAYMRGSRELLQRFLDMPVRIAAPTLQGINRPDQSGAVGVLDFALTEEELHGDGVAVPGFIRKILDVFSLNKEEGF